MDTEWYRINLLTPLKDCNSQSPSIGWRFYEVQIRLFQLWGFYGSSFPCDLISNLEWFWAITRRIQSSGSFSKPFLGFGTGDDRGLSSGHCHNKRVQRQTTSLSPKMRPLQHFSTPGQALVDLGHVHSLRKSNIPFLRVNELDLREAAWLIYCYHKHKWLIWDLSTDFVLCLGVYRVMIWFH